MGIFGANAQKYWDAGLQAIPLYKGQKRPALKDWAKYAEEPISAQDKAHWTFVFQDNNIGLALGPVSDIVIIDIDTDDIAINKIIRDVLPPTPWERRGAKGSCLAFRCGNGNNKTFQIKDISSKPGDLDVGGNPKAGMIVELLAAGRQMVLPPSIHPDTHLPYTSNCDLYDPAVLAQLRVLPPDIEAILRSALRVAGIKLSLTGHTKLTEWVSPGSRDIKMIQMAGFNASCVLKGELSFRRAIDNMLAWCSSQVAKVAGDDVDVEKGVASIAKFLINDVITRNRSLPKGWDDDLTDQEKVDLGLDKFDDIHTPWDFDRLKDYIKGEFMIHDVGTEGRRNAVAYTLARMATATALSELDEPRLLNYIVAAGQLGDTIGSLRKELKKLRGQGIIGDDQTQIAKAVITDLEEFGTLRFVGNYFWQWQGSHWEQLDNSAISKHISNKYGHMQMAKKAGDHAGVMRVMSYQVGNVLKESGEIGVNFANGFLDKDLILRQHDPMYGCTYTLPYRYVPQPWGTRTTETHEATPDGGKKLTSSKEEPWPEILPSGAPMFSKFIKSCWGKDPDFVDKVRGLQEAIGVTLFGYGPVMQRAFCLIGPPKSGKSQLIKLIENMLPKQIQSAVTPESWGDKFLPAELHGKLVNLCGELSDRKNIDGKKFKEIISGDTITVQFKHQQPFRFEPVATHWFSSNHTPKTDDTSEGFNRRWLLFVYNHITSDEDKVLDIGTIIAVEEREVIASWAVQTFPAVVKAKDYTLSASHIERIAEVAKSNNSVLHFVRDSKVVLLQNSLMQTSEPIHEDVLYNAYYTFAIAAGGARAVSQLTFRQKMRELGELIGFDLIIRQSPHGGQDCFYRNLTLVKKGSVSPNRLN